MGSYQHPFMLLRTSSQSSTAKRKNFSSRPPVAATTLSNQSNSDSQAAAPRSILKKRDSEKVGGAKGPSPSVQYKENDDLLGVMNDVPTAPAKPLSQATGVAPLGSASSGAGGVPGGRPPKASR